MSIDELQSDLPSLVQDMEKVISDLQCAESCDSKSDFCDNLDTAIGRAEIAVREIRALLRTAQRQHDE